MTVIHVEWLVRRVAPVEVDETDHIKVLIKLLKSVLEPGNLARLACAISDLIQVLIPLQAVLLNVAIMVGHVDVTAELILGMVLIDIPELRVDAFVEATEHHRQ